LFVRWEGSRERFNVDATGRGMNLRDDDHYRHWPLPITGHYQSHAKRRRSLGI
jgi:hypothetical protein